MTKKSAYQHWQIETDSNNICWLHFDKAESKVNTIDLEVLAELEQILREIKENARNLFGVIVTSKKSTGFIVGADIERFLRIKTIEAAKELIQRGQTVFNQLAELPLPTVAMIEGFCLGGGLELALACTYRVALDEDKKTLGLPEVLLGLYPDWGGLLRLPKLIGAIKAMDLILSGRLVTANTAYKMGFVDAAVPKRHLKGAAEYFILQKPKPHHASCSESLTNHSLVRPLLAKIMHKKIAAKIKPEHYPAPFAALQNWEHSGVEQNKALSSEITSLAKLVLDDTAKNLVRVFFLRERLKGLAKGAEFKVEQVHVIGAGVMGGDIAAWCALQGIQVTLQDQNLEAIAKARQRAYILFKDKLKKPRLIQAAMDRLMADPQGASVKRANLIIEAVVENLKIKQEVLKNIEKNMQPNAFLATNTSSISLDELNTILSTPEILVGIHFFNPVAKMQLVEIVHGKKTSDKVLHSAMAFTKQINRLPVPVINSPGFLVNRILMPYLLESMILLEGNVPAPIIDKVAVDFGMPMGPVELADTVGLDVCLAVAENLTSYYGGEVPERLRQMVKEGELGRKVGKGFYRYKNHKPIKQIPKEYKIPDTLCDRLILRMVNESMACLREKIVADGDLLDAAMIFGTGFAPFRGGPLNYACVRGITKIRDRLNELKELYGERFTPDAEFTREKSK